MCGPGRILISHYRRVWAEIGAVKLYLLRDFIYPLLHFASHSLETPPYSAEAPGRSAWALLKVY